MARPNPGDKLTHNSRTHAGARASVDVGRGGYRSTLAVEIMEGDTTRYPSCRNHGVGAVELCSSPHRTA